METNFKLNKAKVAQRGIQRYTTPEDVESAKNAQKVRFYKSRRGSIHANISEFLELIWPFFAALIFILLCILFHDSVILLAGALAGRLDRKLLMEFVSRIRGKPE